MRTRYFYLNNRENKVDLMDVGRLSAFALTLEPFQKDSDVAEYYAALYNHMVQNKAHILFNCYNLLISDTKGIELLYSNIHFCLYEKNFREENATDDTIALYRIGINDYHRI